MKGISVFGTSRVIRLTSVASVALILALGSYVSPSAFAHTTSRAVSPATFTISQPAPHVPNAAALKKKFGGQSITFYGSSVGSGSVMDAAAAKRFTQDT